MTLEETCYPLLKLYEAAEQTVKLFAGRAHRSLPASMRHGPALTRFQNEERDVETWEAEAIHRYQPPYHTTSPLHAQGNPFPAHSRAISYQKACLMSLPGPRNSIVSWMASIWTIFVSTARDAAPLRSIGCAARCRERFEQG